MENKPVLNFKISPKDTKDELDKESKSYLGDFILFSSGELKKGQERGLHSIIAEFNLEDNSIHYLSTEILYVHKVGGKLVTEYYPIKFDRNPHYTLDYLYSKLSNESITEKIGVIIQEFNKHEYQKQLFNFENSISERERTKLKILENLYNKHILKQG